MLQVAMLLHSQLPEAMTMTMVSHIPEAIGVVLATAASATQKLSIVE